MGIGEAGEKLRRSTVQVRCGSSSSDFNSSGSGVIWDASGTIVTNAHVVRAKELTIELWDGRTVKARLDKRDNRRDLAVLRPDSAAFQATLQGSPLYPARAGDSSRLRVGELVIAVGNPLAPDAAGRVRSMAIRIVAPNGQEWRDPQSLRAFR